MHHRSQPKRKPQGSRRLSLERLEDRITPATLDVLGGMVDYTAGAGVANLLTISTNGTNTTLTDTAETITLTAGAITAGFTGSGTHTVKGPNTSVASFDINTGDMADSVSVLSVQQPLTIDTGSGASTVTLGGVAGVGAQQLVAPVDISSTGGTVGLTIDDTADTTATTVDLFASEVDGLTPGGVTFANLSALTIEGGSGGNRFAVLDTPASVTTTLAAGAGNDLTTVVGTTGSLAYQAAGGSDILDIGNAGLTANLLGSISVSQGTGGSVNLTVDDSADTNAVTATVGATGVTGLTPGGVTYVASALNALSLNSGFGNDTVTVNNTPAGLNTQLFTGEGDDTVTINGDTTGLTVNGNGGNDTFILAVNGVSATINGGSGTDTLSYAGYAATVVNPTLTGFTADGYSGSAPTGGTFTGIDNLIGGAGGTDRLTGMNVASNWLYNGTSNTYTASGGPALSFSAFELLHGGSAADAFNLSLPGQTLGVDGGGGFDTLALQMTGGTLNITNDPLYLVATAVINASSTTATINGALNTNGATRTFQVADGPAAVDLLVNATIAGTGGLTKTGPGLMQLMATNSYTGPTWISAGTLRLTGSITSGVNVTNTATLEGTGTIIGNMVDGVGSTLAPGNGPGMVGKLTVTGNVILLGGSTFLADLRGTGIGQYDVLRGLGGVFLYGGSIGVTSAGFTPATGQAFAVIQAAVEQGNFAQGSSTNSTGNVRTYLITYAPSGSGYVVLTDVGPASLTSGVPFVNNRAFQVMQGFSVSDTYAGSVPNPTPQNLQTQLLLLNSFRAVVVSPPQGGSLVLYPDGSFTYTASPNFVGTDSFTYRFVDPFGHVSPLATVTFFDVRGRQYQR